MHCLKRSATSLAAVPHKSNEHLMIFRRSSNVPALPHYRDYRDLYLRPDFRHRCAYCLTHEFYFLGGEGGQIDHHRPLNPSPDLGVDFSSLKHVYENLYWSCSTCNNGKGNQWPSETQYAAGERFLDPCLEDHDDHWVSYPDGRLIPKTATGTYTIRGIRLNRRRLIQFRQFLFESQRKIREIEAILASAGLTEAEHAALAGQRDALRERLEPPIFDL